MNSSLFPQQAFLNIYAKAGKTSPEVTERAVIMERLLLHIEAKREKLANSSGYVWFNNNIKFIDKSDLFKYTISGVDKRGELMTHCDTFCQVIPNTVNWQYIDNKTLEAVVNEFISCV